MHVKIYPCAELCHDVANSCTAPLACKILNVYINFGVLLRLKNVIDYTRKCAKCHDWNSLWQTAFLPLQILKKWKKNDSWLHEHINIYQEGNITYNVTLILHNTIDGKSFSWCRTLIKTANFNVYQAPMTLQWLKLNALSFIQTLMWQTYKRGFPVATGII